MMPPPFVHSEMFWIEAVYAMIIVASCLIVFAKTRELYEISSYRGIKYFGNAFVFFGIAFISRFIMRLISIIDGPGRGGFVFMGLGQLIFLYAGLMAGFYLIYSSLWKEIENSDENRWILHPLALTIAALIIIFIFQTNVLAVLAIIFVLAYYITYSRFLKSGKTKGFGKMHVLYALLFGAWLTNAATHLFFGPSFAIRIVLYSISSLLFVTVLYRVIRSTR